MSDFVGVWAQIKLAGDGVKKWLAAEVNGGAWDDWTGLLEDVGDGTEGTVGEILDSAKEAAPDGPFFVNVDTKGGTLRVMAMLSLDDNMDTVADLVVALRAADKLGGEGEIIVTSMTDTELNAAVTLAKKASRCAIAKEKSVSKAVDALMEASGG